VRVFWRQLNRYLPRYIITPIIINYLQINNWFNNNLAVSVIGVKLFCNLTSLE
jgi:hypothetical protein